jgi:hypothetical protein
MLICPTYEGAASLASASASVSHKETIMPLPAPGPDDLVVIARMTFLVNNQTGEVVREEQEFNARCR